MAKSKESMPRREDERISTSKPGRRTASDKGTQGSDPSTHGTATDTGLPADHAERTWGGDQDIDTAGMIPGNKATDDKEPTGS
jgi:hypothetical protein